MKNKYTLTDAHDFVKKFQKVNSIEGILYNFDGLKQSMKIFVSRDDEENFKKLTDKYFELVKYKGEKKMQEDAYILLENLCYGIDNQTILRKGSAVKLFEDVYLRRIKMKYNTEGYSPEEVYDKIDSFSNILIVRYPNLISHSEKKWNSKKDTMKFKFESRGHNVSGNMHLNGKELVLEGKIPLIVRPYRKDIVRKIEKTLEELLPKSAESK
jgi:hypothetical protein